MERCEKCEREKEQCVCPKIPINGKWPKNTWFQKRLQRLRWQQANTGASALEVICGLTIAALIAWALATQGAYFRQIVNDWRNIEHCVQGRYNCSNTGG